MKSSKTKKFWRLVGLALFGITLAVFVSQKTMPMMAKQEKRKQTTTASITNTKTISSSEVHPPEPQPATVRSPAVMDELDPVENAEGLKATPKVLVLAQHAVFPDLNTEAGRQELFSEVILSDMQQAAVYEYVDAAGIPMTPNSGEVGFQKIYVEITDHSNGSSIRVPIPVTITDSDTTLLLNHKAALQVKTVNGKILLYSEETKGKSKEEIQQLIKTQSTARAWDVKTGEEVPVTVPTTTVVNDSVGNYTAAFKVSIDGMEATTTKKLMVFGAVLKSPKYFTVKQGSTLAMGSNAAKIFEKYQTLTSTSGASATYQWVANEEGEPTEPVNTFDSRNSGFHWGYIQMTDTTDATISTVIPVPISVLSENQSQIVDSKAALNYETVLFSTSEVEGKTAGQIKDVLAERLSLSAWDVFSDEDLPAQIIDSSITPTSWGEEEITVGIRLGDELLTTPLTVSIFPEGVFPDDDFDEWEVVPANATDGYIANPINHSKLGFPRKGIPDTSNGIEGFKIVDEADISYVHGGGRVKQVPGIDGDGVYGSDWNIGFGLGTGSPMITQYITSSYFLRKGNVLKEILVDTRHEVLYVYNLSMNRNLNFYIELDMYNLAASTRSFAMLDWAYLDYISRIVSIYSLGNNSGFYLEPYTSLTQTERRFSIKLKDRQGNWLSAYQKYIAGSSAEAGLSYPYVNYFGGDFSKAGLETRNYADGETILNLNNITSAYQIAAPWQDVAPGQALKTGYEVFAGEEIPYMELEADQVSWDVYHDYTDEFTTEYHISDIPEVGNTGNLYVIYPNGEEIKIPFTADDTRSDSGTLTIPRSTMSDPLNDEPGTVKEYNTGLIAVNETVGNMNGLPSNELTLRINVYHLGATPIAQTIRKDSVWNKTPVSLVQDPVILPGHTASYEYVNPQQPVDTSVVGLQYAEVRMTDTDEPSRVTIIRVPVMVVDGLPPINGLIVAANDFETSAAEVANLSQADIHALILSKSEAVAWDVTTGLSTGIELSVTTTTLTNQAQDNAVYTATIQAKKGTITQTTAINIRTVLPGKLAFTDTSSLLIDFKLHDPKNTSKIRVNDPTITGKLEVSDTRSSQNSGWTLNVQLAAALTNGSLTLPEAIRYKRAGSDEFIVNTGKQMMVNNSSGSTGIYPISDSWGTTQDSEGFKFEVESVNITELGEYQANLLFTLEETYQP